MVSGTVVVGSVAERCLASVMQYGPCPAVTYCLIFSLDELQSKSEMHSLGVFFPHPGNGLHLPTIQNLDLDNHNILGWKEQSLALALFFQVRSPLIF